MCWKPDFRALLLACCLLPGVATAAEELDAVLARMAINQPGAFHYNETRHIAMLDEPWQGEGNLYARSADCLIKEQISPKRQVMAALKSSLWFFDTEKNIRRNRRISSKATLSGLLGIFRGMASGTRTQIERYYTLSFTSNPDSWQLELKPTDFATRRTYRRFELSGKPGHGVGKILIEQADGDTATITLQPFDPDGVEARIEALLSEVKGR